MDILIYYTVVAVSFVLCVGSLIVLNRHKFGLFTISQHESVLDEREKFITALKNIFLYFILSDTNIEEKLSKIRGYGTLSEIQQVNMRMPYIQTTLLINELINLTHETNNGLVKVKEKAGMRKDRYSSLQYGYALLQELSKDLKPKTNTNDLLSRLTIRPARIVGS